MIRALAVSDEEIVALPAATERLGVDLVIGAGDLPYDYLAELCSRSDRPGVFVPGNHDPDISGDARRAGPWMRAEQPSGWPGPAGFVDADGRVVNVVGRRILEL